MSLILLIEDDELNREMISMRLRWEGYEVAAAEDGREGLALARALAPALILLDLGLPVISGWQVAAHLREDPETAEIPIIVLTAYMLDGEAQVAMPPGCAAYQPKPIDFAQLLPLIAGLVGPAQPAARRFT